MAQERIGVVIPAKNEWNLISDEGLLSRVLKEIPTDLKSTLYICANNSTPEFVTALKDLAGQEDRIKILDLGQTKPLNWSYAYLHGLKVAKDEENKFIVEMDSNGAHDPIYIKDFVNTLKKGNATAISTRFSNGGSIARYSFQRKAISRTGTILANITLGLGQYVPDMTSGYEAFTNEVLSKVFNRHEIEKWICVTKGPGHFYQTEMRAKVIWTGDKFSMVPIEWGAHRSVQPEKLPLKTVLEALKDLVILRSLKDNKKQI